MVLRRAFVAAACLFGSLVVGCYSTIPHRAEVATRGAPRDCQQAVEDVFARAGFIQLSTPPGYAMFFAPRTSGPYTGFLRSGAGVGVSFPEHPTASCHVVLEALSPDVDCPRYQNGFAEWDCHTANTDGTIQYETSHGVLAPCLTVAQACQMSYAPGTDNDAAVDELARRVRAQLGPVASVN